MIYNHSNLCICNFVKIGGCYFSYQATVLLYQYAKTNFTTVQEILSTPIGVNLTLVKQLLRHEDLGNILKEVKETEKKTLITFHHDAEEIGKVLRQVRDDMTHHW